MYDTIQSNKLGCNNEFTWELNRYGQTDGRRRRRRRTHFKSLYPSHRTTAAAAIKSNMDPRYDDGFSLDMSNSSTMHGSRVIRGVRGDIENCARHIMFAIGMEGRYDAKYFVHCIELLEERIVTYHYGFKGAWFSCFVQVGRKGQVEMLDDAGSRRVSATATPTSALSINVYVDIYPVCFLSGHNGSPRERCDSRTYILQR